jgi:hypothetical protein
VCSTDTRINSMETLCNMEKAATLLARVDQPSLYPFIKCLMFMPTLCQNGCCCCRCSRSSSVDDSLGVSNSDLFSHRCSSCNSKSWLTVELLQSVIHLVDKCFIMLTYAMILRLPNLRDWLKHLQELVFLNLIGLHSYS